MNYAVIFAGGTGQRMKNSSRPKQFLELHGKPIIVYTLEVFQAHPQVDGIVVSCVSGWLDYLWGLKERFSISKLIDIVEGGRTSQDSKLHALKRLASIADANDLVLMHDAVRPLVTEQLITDNLECAEHYGNAITVDPFTETGVVSEDGVSVEQVIDRRKLYIAKAPQTFRFGDVLSAHEKAVDMPDAVTIDTCTIMTELGVELHFVQCDDTNIKITRPEDFYIFKALYDLRESRAVLGF